MTFDEVLNGWRQADVVDIHPLRQVDEPAYWDSGVAQAEDAARFIPKGGRVLDFGAGEGRLSIAFAELGLETIAADASQEMLNRLVENARRRQVSVETYLTDGWTLKFRKKFDAVVSRAVLIHHSHADVAKLVPILADVIRKGGHLIADWPVGPDYERTHWLDVSTWTEKHRQQIAEKAGLELVEDDSVSVWKKV